jgi:glycosyltransferase involved in cell wall biosynthesis
VKKNIKQYSLGNVEMVGRVQGEKWHQIISQARVVVVPTITYENCSMTILEALSYGRLVVASDRGGNHELIQPEKTGFLAKPGNVDSFIKNIQTMMELDDKSAQEMILNGRKLVEEKYNNNKYFEQLEEVYDELVKS